jgi:hypothetical protein
MQIEVKNDKGEEITIMIGAQWILHVMEATHLDALVKRVQDKHELPTTLFIKMEWVKNRAIENYCDMRAHGYQMDTDEEIRSLAVQMAKEAQQGLLQESGIGDCNFMSNLVRVFDVRRFRFI